MSDPNEFARILGLTDELGHTPTAAERKKRQDELAEFEHPAKRSLEDEIFWARFASLYLPRFLQSFIDLQDPIWSSTSTAMDYITHVTWIGLIVSRPYFRHLIRTEAVIPLALRSHVYVKISEVNPDHVHADSASGKISYSTGILCLLLVVRSHIESAFQFALSPDIDIHIPRGATRARLDALVPAMEKLYANEKGLTQDAIIAVDHFKITYASWGVEEEGKVGRAYTEKEIEEAASRGGYEESWWRCEALVEKLVDKGECHKGASLMKCGRCHTVRYCSTAHQRLHYKKGHRQVCFAPAW